MDWIEFSELRNLVAGPLRSSLTFQPGQRVILHGQEYAVIGDDRPRTWQKLQIGNGFVDGAVRTVGVVRVPRSSHSPVFTWPVPDESNVHGGKPRVDEGPRQTAAVCG